MSGIAGIYYLDGRPVDTEVDRMVDVMKHRGPDEQATWSDGTIGLGHCMLHTTPESLHASLPQEGAQSGCVITADARIDNRKDLIQNLRLSSGRDQVVPDSTLILHAYEKWGRDCVDHLLGAFAFVIWDPRERCFFCAQDHFGIRPLFYYHEEERLFAFASEIKPLFQIEAVPETLNKVRVAEHLMAPVEEDVTRTFYKEIRRSAPAHTLTVQTNSFMSSRYWELTSNQDPSLSSDRDYAERFQSLFATAVKDRLRSAHPVGSALSGGLDSSSITCQAARILERSSEDSTLHTYSAIFEDAPASDERSYINDVLDKSDNLRPHFIVGDDKSPLAEWDDLYQYLDGPCKAGNVYISWRLYQLAEEQGVRVLLDGFDGDSTVSHGTGWFNQLREEGRWLKLMQEVWAFADAIGESPRDAVWSWIKGPLFSLPGLSQLITARRAIKDLVDGKRKKESETSQPTWRQALRDELATSVASKLNPPPGEKPKTEREHHRQLLDRPLMTRTLDLRNYVASSSSIEVRFPFYDKRLVEFCLSLPPDQKLRKGWSRFILRRSMEGILPSSIQWRPGKSDLSAALNKGLITHERDLIEKLKQSEIGEIEQFVSPDFLRGEVPRYIDTLKKRSGASSGETDLIVWRAFSLALWLRRQKGDPNCFLG
jgi:asparagine synthase (glutamine-hydrolysing)